MKYTHRTGAKLGQYLAMAIGGSIAIQLADLIPELWALIVIACVVGIVYLTILLVRYWGLFKSARWADSLDIHSLDSGLIEFCLFSAPFVGGAIATWLIYSM